MLTWYDARDEACCPLRLPRHTAKHSIPSVEMTVLAGLVENIDLPAGGAADRAHLSPLANEVTLGYFVGVPPIRARDTLSFWQFCLSSLVSSARARDGLWGKNAKLRSDECRPHARGMELHTRFRYPVPTIPPTCARDGVFDGWGSVFGTDMPTCTRGWGERKIAFSELLP